MVHCPTQESPQYKLWAERSTKCKKKINLIDYFEHFFRFKNSITK